MSIREGDVFHIPNQRPRRVVRVLGSHSLKLTRTTPSTWTTKRRMKRLARFQA